MLRSIRRSSSPPCAPLSRVRLPGRQGQGLAPAHAGQLRQGPVQAGGRQQRRRVCAGAAVQAAGRPRRHARLGRRGGSRTAICSPPPATKARSTRSRPTAKSRRVRRRGEPGHLPGPRRRRRRLRRHRPERPDPPHRCGRQGQGGLPDRRRVRLVAGRRREDGRRSTPAPGRKGRIYKITPDGSGNVFYTTKQEHILCLAAGADGTLYAGTDKGGLVYRIDAKGKGFVLYQAAQAEVRSLKVTADAVYAGTSTPTKRHGGAVAASSVRRSPRQRRWPPIGRRRRRPASAKRLPRKKQ